MQETKTALLAEADATVARLRACRDECRTGGQVGGCACGWGCGCGCVVQSIDRTMNRSSTARSNLSIANAITQAAQARLLDEEWPATQRLLQRTLVVWGAASATGGGGDDTDHASDADADVLELDEGERAALRRLALAGLQLMANLTAGWAEGAGRVFEVGMCEAV